MSRIDWIENVSLFAGLLFAFGGAWMIYPPMALLLIGGMLLALAWILARRGPVRRRGK